jgi:hypothetical protein
MDNLVAGLMVLSARQPILTPVFSRSDFKHHVEGSNDGLVAIKAPFKKAYFQPARKREYSVSSLLPIEEAAPIIENISAGESDIRSRVGSIICPANNLVCVEQTSPFGFVSILASDVAVYFTGVYTSDYELLLWSNSDNLEFDQDAWVYRFVVRSTFSTVLQTKRICARWYRYSQTPTMREPAKRFQALENSMFQNHASTS